MAKIREYTNETVLKADNRGTEALSNTAQAAATSGFRISQMLKGTGNELEGSIKDVANAAGAGYTNVIVQPEISKGGVVGAGELNRLTKEWNELAAKSPVNDSTIADKFREEKLLPALEKFKSGFSSAEGQKWGEDYALRLQQHMDNKLISDTATRAGAAVRANVETLQNTLSSTVLGDPSSFDFAIDTLNKSITDLVKNTPNLSPEAAAAVQSKLLQDGQKKMAQAAIGGIARVDAAEAMRQVQSGKFSKYLDGTEELKYLKQVDSFNKAEVRAAREEKRRQLEDAGKKELNKIILSTIDPDTGRTVVPPGAMRTLRDSFGRLSEGNPQYLSNSIAWLKAAEKQEGDAITNPQARNALAAQLFDPKDPLTEEKVLHAWHVDKSISKEDATDLLSSIGKMDGATQRALGGKPTVDAIKAAITYERINLGIKDPKGSANFATALRVVGPAYQERLKAGKAEPGDLDLANKDSWLSRAVKPFQRDIKQRTDDYAEELKEMTEAARRGSGGSDPSRTTTPNPNMPKWINDQGFKNISVTRDGRFFVDLDTGTEYTREGKKTGKTIKVGAQ